MGRTYLNNEVFNALPGVLKEKIIDTYVVSGREYRKKDNYKTTDKLYLLSVKEIHGEQQVYDSMTETRQLDYYKSIGVTITDYSKVIKNYNSSSFNWWLRSAYSISTNAFYQVRNNGSSSISNAINANGVAPAFRI